jgi:uncharacterized delta-60 repeat protein
MKKKSTPESAIFKIRVLLGLFFFFTGVCLTLCAASGPQKDALRLAAQLRRADGAPLVAHGGVQESWVARYNGPGNYTDEAVAIAVDGSGNVYVTGESSSQGGPMDYATIKYNSAGEEQWVVRYNGPGNGDDRANAIAIDASGNVYVTGESLGEGTGIDYATIKYNSAGQQQWVARYDGPASSDDYATAIAIDGSGNVYVTGTSSIDAASNFDYLTVKYNSAGEEQWVASYNGPGNALNFPYAIAVDSSGNVYVTGESYGLESASDYATIKYNSTGQEQWVARYNGPANYNDAARAIALDASANVYVTGYSFGVGDVGNDYATIKYNPAGQQEWVARYNGPASLDDYATAIAVDSSGNVYVTGGSAEVDYASGYATIKYDSAGQQQWIARYNGPANSVDFAEAIAVDSSGDVYVTGGSVGQATRSDFATVKYNSTGQEQWVARYDGPGNGDDQANAIALDAFGNVYVTGQSFDPNNGDDYVTIKYVQGATPTPTPTATPTGTPTATPTPTPKVTPRPVPIPRPRPTPHPRPDVP